MGITAIDMIRKISKEIEDKYNWQVECVRYDKNDENIELHIHDENRKHVLYHWGTENEIYSVLFGMIVALDKVL
jgi:hypothetical protein